MRKKIELLVLLLALAGIYTVSRNLEKYVQSDQVKSEQERKMDLVVIDSGHGGSDPGKVGINEVLEKDINLKISKQVEKELKNKGYQVVMTREKVTQYTNENSELLGNDIYGIQEDKNGDILIGMLDGCIQKLDVKNKSFIPSLTCRTS